MSEVKVYVKSRVDGLLYGEALIIASEDVADGRTDIVKEYVKDWKKHLENKVGKECFVEYRIEYADDNFHNPTAKWNVR